MSTAAAHLADKWIDAPGYKPTVDRYEASESINISCSALFDQRHMALYKFDLID